MGKRNTFKRNHSTKHTITLSDELWKKYQDASFDLDMPISAIIEMDLRKLDKITRTMYLNDEK